MKEGTDAARVEKTGAAVRKSVFFFFCQSVAGRQTICEWSNSKLVPLPVSLRVGRWQALILPSDCLCQQFVKETFLEFSMLNVEKVARRIHRDCAHAKQLMFYVLTERDIPLPIVLAACGLYYIQTGVKLATHAVKNLSFSILLNVSCCTEASVLFPWCAVVSWQKFTCWRSHSVCVHHRDWLGELIWPSLSEQGDGMDAVSWRYAAIWWRSLI